MGQWNLEKFPCFFFPAGNSEPLSLRRDPAEGLNNQGTRATCPNPPYDSLGANIHYLKPPRLREQVCLVPCRSMRRQELNGEAEAHTLPRLSPHGRLRKAWDWRTINASNQLGHLLEALRVAILMARHTWVVEVQDLSSKVAPLVHVRTYECGVRPRTMASITFHPFNQ